MNCTNFFSKIHPGDEKKIFLTSDTHHFHKNILKYCSRPWDTVEEMNEALIKNWNSVVGKDDHVYHLGDFCFGNIEKWNTVLEYGVLNGHIHLILGNHDYTRVFKEGVKTERFDEILPQKTLFIDGWTVYLNHFPYLDFSNNIDHKVMQLHGHVHYNGKSNGTLTPERVALFQSNQYDVGVDNNNYTPISWNDVLKKIEFQIENNVNMSYWYDDGVV